MIGFGRSTVRGRHLISLLLTMTTLLLLSSSTFQCIAAFIPVVAASDEAAADTTDGESIATDATAPADVAEITTTTHTDKTKKERVLRKTWTLFHSVDSTGQANDMSFTPRAKVVLEIHANNDDVVKNAKTTATTTPPPVLTIENHPDCLSQDSVHRMMKTQWYQLKLVEDDDNAGSQPPPPVLATVPACRMRLANFRDELVLTFGTNGHVISLASMPLVSPLAPPNCDDESLLPTLMKMSNSNRDDDVVDDSSRDSYIKLESRISFETAVPGMLLRSVLPTYQPPPGLKYLNTKSSSSGGTGIAAGAAATDKPPPGVFGQDSNQQQAPPDNSMFGFMSRYWYILAPIILLNLFSSEPPPPADEPQAAPRVQQQQQQHQQRGGGGGGATVQQAAPAASPSAQAPQGDVGSARQRRGKRG